ncbi:SET domain-containing protein-lysine N-methyltransferase [Candidatus Woesebacteria bacterium]|nr:SET domain-containing protein-lysine N-methyltransferase [Candidatus Woesebacteria bacterium]
MKNFRPPQKIYIKTSDIKSAGRGVFAREKINKGEIIEICPFIKIDKNDPENLFGGELVTYFFYFGKNREEIALLLGFGSLYNHSYSPNCKYEIKPKERVVRFTATRNIKINEEITFNYKGDNTTKLWFE